MNKFILFFVSIILLSCQVETQFNSDHWKNSGGENITTSKRKNMVKDLLKQKYLLNKSQKEIHNQIGKPSKTISNIEYFTVQEIYSNDIDPDKIIYLEITYSKTGVSKKVELNN